MDSLGRDFNLHGIDARLRWYSGTFRETLPSSALTDRMQVYRVFVIYERKYVWIIIPSVFFLADVGKMTLYMHGCDHQSCDDSAIRTRSMGHYKY